MLGTSFDGLILSQYGLYNMGSGYKYIHCNLIDTKSCQFLIIKLAFINTFFLSLNVDRCHNHKLWNDVLKWILKGKLDVHDTISPLVSNLPFSIYFYVKFMIMHINSFAHKLFYCDKCLTSLVLGHKGSLKKI